MSLEQYFIKWPKNRHGADKKLKTVAFELRQLGYNVARKGAAVTISSDNRRVDIYYVAGWEIHGDYDFAQEVLDRLVVGQ